MAAKKPTDRTESEPRARRAHRGRAPRVHALGSNTITVLHAPLDLKAALIRESAAAAVPLSLYVAAILTALGPEERRALDLSGRALAERERTEIAS